MFTDKIWITNGVKKVKNPAKIPQVNDVYQGILQENHDFKFQTENCNGIKERLEPRGIYMTEIYSAKRSGKVCFVVLFNDPNIIWQKYEGCKHGSSQNYMYFKDQTINTKLFIDLTNDEVSEFLNGASLHIFIEKRQNGII
jgi:hypothetical protein